MVKNSILCYNSKKKKRNTVMGFKDENEITVRVQCSEDELKKIL